MNISFSATLGTDGFSKVIFREDIPGIGLALFHDQSSPPRQRCWGPSQDLRARGFAKIHTSRFIINMKQTDRSEHCDWVKPPDRFLLCTPGHGEAAVPPVRTSGYRDSETDTRGYKRPESTTGYPRTDSECGIPFGRRGSTRELTSAPLFCPSLRNRRYAKCVWAPEPNEANRRFKYTRGVRGANRTSLRMSRGSSRPPIA